MKIPKTMKALVAKNANEYVYMEVPVPVPGEGEILIKVEACGICAGDIKASHGAARFWGGDSIPGYCKPPFIPGHEFYGRIVAMGGNVEGDFHEGDRIITEQIVPCGECYYCKRDLYWLCEPHDVYGFKNYLNGGMAQYALLPKKAINYRIPDELTMAQATLIEPLACSLHAVRQGQVQSEDTVVLAGAGTLGLGMVNILREISPKKLIVLDLINSRLELALRFGADVVINPSSCNALETVLKLTDGVGCDVYIEATGNPSAVQQGLDMLRKGGRFVEFSVMSGTSTIDWSIIGDMKEITIQGSQLSPYCFAPIIQAMVDGKIQTEGIITHWFPLEQWEEAFRVAQSKEALKVVLTF